MRITADPSTDAAHYGFVHRIRVRFSETDAMGIVHHSRYLPYLEETRVAYLRAIGHPYHESRAEGIDFAVVEQWIGYRSPLCFDEQVDIHLRVTESTRATFHISYLITVDADVRAVATTVHGAVTAVGRPTRLPLWMATLAAS